MSKLSYGKYSGCGNSFILIDDREREFSQDVRLLCDEADTDGVILLQTDPAADFRMRIFNRDGSEAESCGNGLRCLLRFLSDLGFPKKTYRIAAADRIVTGSYVGDLYSIDLGAPQGLKLHLQIDDFILHSVDTGVPHAVLFVPDLQKIDIPHLGAYLRSHPHFAPRGTNVNFATLQPDKIEARTFERGVGEVLSCGTGAAAVAVIASSLFQLKSPILIATPGGELQVKIGESITLLGTVEK